MAETKHTPGPWVLWSEEGQTKSGAYRNSVCKSDGLEDPNHVCLADVTHPDEETSHWNALLIAAAPELLEALKELLAHASFVGIASHYEQMARAAIAKAEDAALTQPGIAQ